MLIIVPPTHDKANRHLPPTALCEYHALKAPALDPERYPILSKHWPFALIVGDRFPPNLFPMGPA